MRRLALLMVALSVGPALWPWNASSATESPPQDAAAKDAQDKKNEKGEAGRPTIGLALSGGGAKGIAHVGVLKVLEEMRIPVDYIAGTSMGAIVGGLYATGMSVEQLEELALTTDWHDVLDDAPSREDLSFRRKSDDLRYLADLELGLEDWKIR